MIYTQIGILLISGLLWRLGGWDKARWAGYRDVLIPIILCIYYGFTLHIIVGLLVGGATNSIRMGYGAYDPDNDDKPSWLGKITKDRKGWIIRGIYGFITSFAIGLFPFIYLTFFKHESVWIFYLIYIGLNTGLEILLNRLKANVWPTEILNGIARASVILCLK